MHECMIDHARYPRTCPDPVNDHAGRDLDRVHDRPCHGPCPDLCRDDRPAPCSDATDQCADIMVSLKVGAVTLYVLCAQ